MLKFVELLQMQSLDQQVVNKFGLPSLTLMELAGQSLANRVRTLMPWNQESKLVVVCGSGKNGGDGLVAARLLLDLGFTVKVVMVKGTTLAKETEYCLTQFVKNNGQVVTIKNRITPVCETLLEQADLIIDAVLGIGLNGLPREPIKTLINLMNHAPGMILSVDIPSGLTTDVPTCLSTSVHADFTLTFGLPKKELFDAAAAECVGQLSVDTIGFPKALIMADQDSLQYMDAISAARLLPKRAVNAHKKNTGKVVMIGGSGAYHGAVLLAARGALRMGSGHVTQAYPHQLNTIIREHALETLCVPLPCNQRCSISRQALATMLQLAQEKDALVLGPGMGWERTTQQLIMSFVLQVQGPKAMVIDADALHAIAAKPDQFAGRNRVPAILTPHEGEAAVLMGEPNLNVRQHRVEVARQLAARYQAIIVLKGQHSIVTAPNRPTYIIGSGTQALAVAGTGDVLCGMIGSLVAQQVDPLEAALLATFVHGLAGTLASPDPFGLGARAGEIADAVPQAIADLRYHQKTYIDLEPPKQSVRSGKEKKTKKNKHTR